MNNSLLIQSYAVILAPFLFKSIKVFILFIIFW